MADAHPVSRSPESYPYVTHLNVLFDPLAVVDVPALVEACTDRWYNQTLCRVNDSVVRLGVLQGEYHWHKHDDEDEFFYVIEGALTIEIEGMSPVDLAPGQGVTVPRGRMHCPHAHGRSVVLMVEKASVTPTGD